MMNFLCLAGQVLQEQIDGSELHIDYILLVWEQLCIRMAAPGHRFPFRSLQKQFLPLREKFKEQSVSLRVASGDRRVEGQNSLTSFAQLALDNDLKETNNKKWKIQNYQNCAEDIENIIASKVFAK